MFVRGIERGGLYLAVLQVDTVSSEESESIAASLKGSYLTFSAQAQMNFQETMKNKNFKMYLYVYHEGGPPNVIPENAVSPVDLFNSFKKWLGAFENNPDKYAVPFSAVLSPITLANGPTPANQEQMQHAVDVLKICSKERYRILDSMNLLEYIISNATRYNFVSPTTKETIVKAYADFQADLDLVSATASLAINNMAQAMTPAQYATKMSQSYPHSLPDPMPTLTKIESQPGREFLKPEYTKDEKIMLIKEQMMHGSTSSLMDHFTK
jgi:hypothetical protein